MILVALNQIEDNPFQERTEYGDIESLARNILAQHQTRPDTKGLQQVPNGRLVSDDGLLVPIANLDEDDLFKDGKLRAGWIVQLEFAHRRLRAFRWLFENGYSSHWGMPVFIRDLTDEQMLDGVHSENAQRKDISAVEEALLIQAKMGMVGGKQKDVAAAWGLGRSTIANKLRLLKLPKEVQELNRAGELTERQAIALLPLMEVKAKANGAKWGKAKNAATWEAPIDPSSYVEHVIKKGVSSEDIREFADKAVKHAGELLTKDLMSLDCSLFPDVLRPKCRGCEMRVNQSCFDSKCLEVKKGIYRDVALKEAAEQTGARISDDPKHFTKYQRMYDGTYGVLRERLAAKDENSVIGWSNTPNAPRALTGDNYVTPDELYCGLNGIVVGYDGKLPKPKAKEGKSEGVGKELLAEWAECYKQLAKQQKAIVIEAVAASLEGLNFQPLFAFIKKEGGGTAKCLAKFAWEKGFNKEAYNMQDMVEECHRILENAGINDAELAGEQAVLKATMAHGLQTYFMYWRKGHHSWVSAATKKSLVDMEEVFEWTAETESWKPWLDIALGEIEKGGE